MEENEALEWSLQLLESQPDSADASFEENRNLLIRIVNQLIQSDFNKLINILYRIDVDEQKLKDALFENPLPPAETIADMIIKRQLQKVHFREQFKNKNKEQ
ncbi:MAG TPA: hypothetical protein VLY87_02220 [Flavobacterium sp.]|nr:hypothetical protein [Flavobacterium sp.]